MKHSKSPWLIWLKLTALVFILITTSLVGLAWYLAQPVSTGSNETVTVVIPPGSSSTRIGEILKEKNLIRSNQFFQLVVWKDGLRGRLQAGSFQLKRSQSTSEIAVTLTRGTSDVWITIAEGLRAEEIGEILEENLDNFSRTDESYQSECLDYEGYLFPETYLMPLQFSTAQACRLLRLEYGNRVPFALREAIHQAGRTEEEVITLASIVQREAKRPEDMKIVAGILWNRLDIDMPLQVDATLQYIRGYDETTDSWWPVPRSQDKELESPYNTYKYPGLPPGPISNPGIDAIHAAIYPTASDYLYYISNTSGTQMYYAQTFEQHRQNIIQYLQ